MKKRVVLFDDHYFFRESIRMILEESPDFELAGEFEHANNLLVDIHLSRPDVILMDIDMPGASGIDAVRELKEHFPQLPVIMLTQYDEEDKVINSICAGANGYLLKTTSGERVMECLHEVLQGGSPLNPGVARKVLSLFSEKFAFQKNGDTFMLSPREKEVLTQLVKGHSYKMIACELNICYDTVRMHIKSIYHKLQVSSVSGAVAIAIRRNIVAV